MTTETNYSTVVTKNTFKAESNLTSVNLNNRPIQNNTLEEGFLNCIRLETLNNSVTSVTNLDKAFYNCTSLKSIPEIPSACTSMNGTLQNCIKFNSQVSIPSSVTDIDDCFNGCKNLSITPTFATRTAATRFLSLKRTFKGTNITETTPIADVDTTLEEAFMNCRSLTTVKLDTTLTTHAGTLYSQDMTRTFYGCVNLKTLPYISSSKLKETFAGCQKLSGVVVIPNSEVNDATDCFTLQNSNPLDKNVYIPFGTTAEPTTTYTSFKTAGYSYETRKDGVLLIPSTSNYVTFTITSNGEQISGVENASVVVTYNGASYTCRTTISTHSNGECQSGCAKNVFYAIIPNNTAFTYTITLDKFVTKTGNGTSPQQYTEQNINIDLTRSTSNFTITTIPVDSTINLYKNGTAIVEGAVGTYTYAHATGESITLTYTCSHSNLLSVSGSVTWDTNEDASKQVNLNTPSYNPGDIIWESNVGGDSNLVSLYKNYVYQLTCVGGGGGSSRDAGGAGATWIGEVYVTENNVIYGYVGQRGDAAPAYCRNNDGLQGGTSYINNNKFNIQCYGGYGGRAARHSVDGVRGYSPVPSASVGFVTSVEFANTYQQRQASYIDGTLYGQGGNGGYNGKTIGGYGYPGYIKVMYVDSIGSAGDDGQGTKIFESSTGGATGTLTLSSGLYRVTCVGAGGGCLYYTSPTNELMYYKSSGGSGGGFKATLYLPAGDYTYAVGSAGTSSKAPNECTNGGNTTFQGAVAHGGEKGTVNLGVYSAGNGGAISDIPFTCYETVFNSAGNDGATDTSTSVTITGGTSIYNSYGSGGGLNAGSVVNATNGYIKIVQLPEENSD